MEVTIESKDATENKKKAIDWKHNAAAHLFVGLMSRSHELITRRLTLLSSPTFRNSSSLTSTFNMGFKRFVEVGRVVLINYGPEEGKLAVIIDIVDQNKCLIDGPSSGVARQVIPFKRIALTDFVIKIQLNAREKTLKKAWSEADIDNKWEATSWAKKLSAKKKRAALNDFDRFKVMVARKQKSAIIAKKMEALA